MSINFFSRRESTECFLLVWDEQQSENTSPICKQMALEIPKANEDEKLYMSYWSSHRATESCSQNGPHLHDEEKKDTDCLGLPTQRYPIFLDTEKILQCGYEQFSMSSKLSQADIVLKLLGKGGLKESNIYSTGLKVVSLFCFFNSLVNLYLSRSLDEYNISSTEYDSNISIHYTTSMLGIEMINELYKSILQADLVDLGEQIQHYPQLELEGYNGVGDLDFSQGVEFLHFVPGIKKELVTLSKWTFAIAAGAYGLHCFTDRFVFQPRTLDDIERLAKWSVQKRENEGYVTAQSTRTVSKVYLLGIPVIFSIAGVFYCSR
ncbi:MAG: hypothetical protein S4CHLAM123_15480 [Chlamydiales bacterium]|nr:hypothetical protein [Chlamydiales bacterium]